MRIVIDALGAPGSSGGMRAYAQEVVETWQEQFAEDELIVLGYEWLRSVAQPTTATIIRREGFSQRFWGQWITAGLVARRANADALLSCSQVVSPLFPGDRRYCVVHDWRHLVRPREFGFAQRLYRRTWKWSVARSAMAFQISDKTAAETLTFVPKANTHVTPNGCDSARRWDVVRHATGNVVTFGHFANKRAGLVIEAFARLEPDQDLDLVVLGARGEYAKELAELAETLGIERLSLPGYVDTNEYQRLISSASVVVLASSDEGFGLPVAEAGYFGVPCVVTRDGGLGSIHPGRVIEVDPTPESLSGGIAAAVAAGVGTADSDQATWSDHVSGLRGAMSSNRGVRE